MGSETLPILVMLDADCLAEDSTHVFSKANVGDFEMDLGVTVVVSTNVVGIR